MSNATEPSLSIAFARRRELRMQVVCVSLGVIALAGWSSWGTGFDIPQLIAGLPNIYDLARRMLPPDVSVIRELIHPLVETLQMAVVGTVLAASLALPLGILAANNTSPYPLLAVTVRMCLNTLRTIPELVFALLLVSAVGLGTFPGVLALTLHATGGLGKFFTEAIESVNPTVSEAIEATGATRYQVIWFGVLPSALPLMMSSSLFYWEYNSRASTILGLVGAGGIGFTFTSAMQAFEYPKATSCLILIVLILAMIDRISAWLRARVI
jgi:phosphonate transport system permease protein